MSMVSVALGCLMNGVGFMEMKTINILYSLLKLKGTNEENDWFAQEIFHENHQAIRET